MSVVEDLQAVDCTHVCPVGDKCVYGKATCPTYWREVFVRHYGTLPSGDNDARWTELFRLASPPKEEATIR